MAIKCCNGCVPPKRNPYCHSYCPEYIEEKAKHDAEKAIEDQKRATKGNLNAQKLAGVNKANKKRKGGKG